MPRLFRSRPLIALVTLLLSRQAALPLPPAPFPQQASIAPESNQAMGQRLRSIYRSTDWQRDPNKTAERAAYYGRLLREQKLTPADELTVRRQLSTEQLRSGDPEAALKALDGTEALATQLNLPHPAETQLRRDLLHQRAITFLRLGETENCLAHHGAHSCVFPIRAGGVHTLTRGAEGAIRDFTALLKDDPSDDLARWLLNVASMQLGRYPRDLPPKYLLPASLFKSDREEPEWPDMAALAGIDLTTRSGGAVVEDFDSDGLLDIVTSTSNPTGPMHLFHNNGDGTFSDRTAAAGLLDEVGGLNLVLTDYDNDGHPDLLVLRGAWWGNFGRYPLSLLRNRGDGTFEDVTVHAGLLTSAPTQTAAWADFDNDGNLDLFVGHENNPEAGEHFPSQLFHNNGDGTFTDIAKQLGLSEQGFVKGVAWGDFNNDGRPDLYISCKNGENRLYRNDGPNPPQSAGTKKQSSFRPERSALEKPAVLQPATTPGAPPSSRSSRLRWVPREAPFAQTATRTFTPATDPSFRPERSAAQKPPVFPPSKDPGAPASAAPSPNLGSATILGSATTTPNPFPWRFTDVTAPSGLAHQHNTFATWFFDYNNDGWPDIFVAGYSAASMQDVGHFQSGHPADANLPHLYRNNRNGTFTDVAHDLHLDRAMLTMGANFGDLDNDGYLDLYLGTGEPSYEALLPNRLFRNAAGKRFEDITSATGLGHLQKGHSIAFADIENRGLEDIFELMGGAFPGDPYQSALYRNPLPDPIPASEPQTNRVATNPSYRPQRSAAENPSVLEPTTTPGAPPSSRSSRLGWVSQPATNSKATTLSTIGTTNHSITLKLEGTRTNRAAYGTRIDIAFTDHNEQGKPLPRHVYRTVGAVSSFGGNPMAQHIGIGQATTVDEIRLRWPTDPTHEQTFGNLPADRLYRLTEADPIPHPIPQPHFHLGDHLAPMQHSSLEPGQTAHP